MNSWKELEFYIRKERLRSVKVVKGLRGLFSQIREQPYWLLLWRVIIIFRWHFSSRVFFFFFFDCTRLCILKKRQTTLVVKIIIEFRGIAVCLAPRKKRNCFDHRLNNKIKWVKSRHYHINFLLYILAKK